MKKILLSLAILAASASSGWSTWYVDEAINTSTFTTSNDGIAYVSGTRAQDSLVAVVVASPTTGGILGIYDSSASFTNFITSVSLTSTQNPFYYVQLSSGLSYKTTGLSAGSGGVTIIYRKRQAQ